ncbi:MAG: segregation/condensation protein A [Acidobacteriaceae bacterium]|nr:segregation/condensation protein A [Acidobacteriaceae bacterium]
MADEILQPENTANAAGEAPEVSEEASADNKDFALKHPVPAPAPEPKRGKQDKEKDKEEASQSPFSVIVGQVYDGPLDLLLDLIRKQNIDIYDIPIARITAQFLEYTHQLQQTDVDAAGEFIYMASLLIHIKSKMLLPRDPSDVAGEIEDPRRELVERLLEHERFKAAAQMLLQKQQIEEATWTVSGIREFREEAEGEREIAADTVDLVRIFREILERIRNRPVLDVDEESVTVAQMIEYVKRRLMMEERPVSLRRLLHNTHTERALICTFLALLELVRLQAVLLHQPVAQGDILIKKTNGFDQIFADQPQTLDDWR